MNGKVDLRIVKTHSKLTAALSEMMNEMAFDDVTVFDLCEKANVRRATFYKHFKDKYDFLKGVTTKIISDIELSLVSDEYSLLSPVNYFTHFVDGVIVYFEARPVILKNLLNSNTFPIMFDIITSCTHSALVDRLNDAKRDGANLTTDVLFTANFINGGIANILLEWFREHKLDKEVLLMRISEVLAKIFA